MFRPSADLFHGVHFQASQWGSSDEGQLTINLVVTSETIYKGWTGHSLPRNPACAAFPIQQRIGALMPQRRDHWWPVSGTTDVATLGQEVMHALVTYALPFFAEFPDSNSLLGQLRENKALPGLTSAQRPLIHAMLAKSLGFPQEATAQVRKAFEDAGASPFKATVEVVGQRIGVL
jgi:hypothetical protein